MPHRRRHLAIVVVGLIAALSPAPPAALAKDGDDRREARVGARCDSGVHGELRLRAEDETIRIEFRLRYRPRRLTWRLTIVQEHRVVWRGTASSGPRGTSIDVRRTIQDLAGADEVSIRASAPRGLTCDARAVLTAHDPQQAQ